MSCSTPVSFLRGRPQRSAGGTSLAETHPVF
jgi:hypothetical protein